MVGSSMWIVVVVSLLCGVGLGLVAGYLTFPAIREAKRLRIRLDETLREHETYKASVSAHFRKTGELVNEMTRSYAAVYDHLASGARDLGGDLAAETTLPFGPSPELLASPVIETHGTETSGADSSGFETKAAGTNGTESGAAASTPSRAAASAASSDAAAAPGGDGDSDVHVSTAGTSVESDPDDPLQTAFPAPGQTRPASQVPHGQA